MIDRARRTLFRTSGFYRFRTPPSPFWPADMPGSVVLPHAAVGRPAGIGVELDEDPRDVQETECSDTVVCVPASWHRILALGVAQFDSSRLAMVPTLSLRWDTLSPDPWLRYEHEKGFYLIDRVSGSSNLVPLPDEDQWGLLSVSPWSDAEGNREVVGHCHSLARSPRRPPVLGSGPIELPEGRVIERVKLDLLPSGRPCWLPDRPGEILFAAGDGQFYRYSFGADEEAGVAANRDSRGGSRGSGVRQVVWKCPRPGKGSVLVAEPGLADPSTISKSGLRHTQLQQSAGRQDDEDPFQAVVVPDERGRGGDRGGWTAAAAGFASHGLTVIRPNISRTSRSQLMGPFP